MQGRVCGTTSWGPARPGSTQPDLHQLWGGNVIGPCRNLDVDRVSDRWSFAVGVLLTILAPGEAIDIPLGSSLCI